MRKNSIPEINIQLRLWEIFKNVIYKDKFSYEDIQFVDIKVEPRINGQPDILIYAAEETKAKKIPLLVIETKRKVPYKDPRFDPYSIEVIKQAVGYANLVGAPYFATCNGDIMVVFETFSLGVPLIQRRMKQYKVSFDEEFARIVLKELVRFKLGVGKWLPLDDIFVERLRSFHRFITPFMYKSLNKKLKKDRKFKSQYVTWLKSQMLQYSDRFNETIAEQMAYLLMNKIAFYKTLESQIVDVDIDKLKKIEAANGAEFSEKLQEKFKHLTNKADYEGVFSPTVLDKVPVHDKLVHHLNEFIEELDAYNLGKIRSDVLGRVYEDLIPADERHKLGQYYTPPPIVDLIVEMCIKSPNDKVLDPACGSGSFLVKGYHKLRDLKKKENPFKHDDDLHKELLEQVYGIDINPFPAQLSSINLAIRNLKVRSERINLFPMDFFKVKPEMPLFPKEFNVVVTNPPYTRQEEMEYKDQIREEALTYSDGSEIELDARAGIYAYFFTHSGKFLKNKGRMGYITSNAWLDVGYGKGLKKFFLDHFKILVILEFDAAVFGRALVNTCVSILEKTNNSRERSANSVKFVRLKKAIEIDKVTTMLKSANKNYENDSIRIIIQRQNSLKPKERWGKYIRAPEIYFEILNKPVMTRLGNFAEIRRGITTGCNDFFILDEDKLKVWGIDEEFLSPVVTSSRRISTLRPSSKDIKEKMLMIHSPRNSLKGTNVLKYIEHGEDTEIETKRGTRVASEVVRGIHNLRTCKSRKLWYDLGARNPALILFPYLIWEDSLFIQNKGKAYATDVFHEIHLRTKADLTVLLGILNSTLTSFLLEFHGRSYGGGVLKVQVYELEDLPIVDLEKLKRKERKRIEKAFLRLCKLDLRKNSRSEHKARIELDNAVFDVIKLTKKERRQVYDGLKSLREMRLKRKEVNALVETAEKWKPRKKKKRRKLVEDVSSKRLDTWMRGRVSDKVREW